MKSLKDRGSAAALAAAPNEEYLARLPASRPRLETLIGVAPAAPIVTGHPDAPVSRVRPRVDPRPELPRSPIASKHTLDALAINAESPPVVAAPKRKGRAALLAVLAVIAAVAFVGARRASHFSTFVSPVLATEPPFAASLDLPPVSPATFREPPAAEATHATTAKPPRKIPPRHKHRPKPR